MMTSETAINMDECAVRQEIADTLSRLKLLRRIAKAMADHRREQDKARAVRRAVAQQGEERVAG